MGGKNPIKSVGLCFFKTGAQAELFFPSDEASAATSIALFLDSSDAAILSAENFSHAELSYLHGRRNASGRSVFVGPDCAGQSPLGRGCRCEKICPLREGSRGRGMSGCDE